MFLRWNSFVACVLMSILSAPSQALDGCQAEMGAEVEEDNTAVYFVNGMDTGQPEAYGHARRLNSAYKSALESRDMVTYEFNSLYNDTESLAVDIILEVEAHRIADGLEGVSAYQIYRLVRAGLSLEDIHRLIGVWPLVPDAATLIARLTPDVYENITNILLGRGIGDQARRERIRERMRHRNNVLTRHLSKLEADLQAGKRVIIVAHSQGNLFTNTVVDLISTRQPDWARSIAVIGVATPAASIANPWSYYVSAHDDRFLGDIHSLALVRTWDVLPPNVDNSPRPDNNPYIRTPRGNYNLRIPFLHSFERAYFAEGLASRAKIDMHMEDLAETLPYPSRVAGEGAIRATLTWGPQPDVDLHVFEPNGSHVYYNDLTGQSGTLDVDDTESFGPENYVVACDKVEVGVYTVGVNYFRGNEPETANVALFLGDGSSTAPREVPLNSARGRAGNTSPVTVFEIEVADMNGRATYTVR